MHQEVFATALDLWPTPVLLLDRVAQIFHANQAAKDLIERGPVFSFRSGRLWARRQDEAKALHEAVLRVAQDASPELLRFCGRQGQLVTAVLLRPASAADGSTLVLALVADLLSPLSAHPDWIAGLFGLTKGEARIVAELADGFSLNELSARLGLSVHTTRGHLKRVMAKAGVQSQARLVGLVARSHGALALAEWKFRPTGARRRALVPYPTDYVTVQSYRADR